MLAMLAYAAFLPTVPGVPNPAVTQSNIGQTICNPVKQANGKTWVHNQRPPVAYTNKIKFALMDKAGIPRSKSALYELDHKLSIEDGGSPTDPNNLWLQPYFGDWNAHIKDVLETRLNKLVCTGKITLAEDQHELMTDWIAAYKLRIKP